MGNLVSTKIAFAKIHFQKTVGSNYCEPGSWLFTCKFFQSRMQVGQLESYGISLGLHVKMIAIFITCVQYLVETLLSNIHCGKLQ